jgi:hypothetical protein
MADYNTATGDNVNLRVNQGGAGFYATVQDNNSGNATRFKVAGDNGVVTVFERIDRSGAHVLNVAAGGPANDMLYLQQGTTTRMEFSRDATNTRAVIKASVSGDALRIEGETVHLNTPNSTGTIATFRTNGTSRATLEYESGSVTTTLRSSSNLTLKSDEFMVIHFGASTGTSKTLRFLHTAPSGTEYQVAAVNETGAWDWCDPTTGAVEATLLSNDAAAPPNCSLDLGIVAITRGMLIVRGDPTGGAQRPGVIKLETQDTVNGRNLWVYAWYDGAAPAGQRDQLRCHTADPGSTNVGKVIVSF